MERNPTNPSNTESSTLSPDSSGKEKKSKKKILSHVPLEAPKASKEIKANPEAVDKPVTAPAETITVTEISKPTAEEVQHINSEIAAQRLVTASETANDDEVSREHADAFLQQVEEGVDPELAFTNAAAEAGMNEEEINAALAEVAGVEDIESEAVFEDHTEDGSEATDESEDNEEPSTDEQGWELPLREEPTEESPQAAGASTAGRSGSQQPPNPPQPPTGPSPTPGGQQGPANAVFNQPPQPQPTSTEATPVAATPVERHNPNRAPAGQILVAALVGYLVGRRRGRIKTEKRMIKVQKKLETKVKSLEQNIARKEQILVNVNKKSIEQRTQPAANTTLTEVAPVIKAPTEQRMQPGRIETRIGMQKPERTERLAHMIVAAEAPTNTRKLLKKETVTTPSIMPEAVTTMNREELLSVSEKIVIEGASLRKIYESHLIGERQLRHLVGEHLQGKDIHKSLRREMVEREIDFERDPILRDRIHSEITKDGDAGGLGSLLASAGVTSPLDDQQMQRQIEKEQQRERQADQKRQMQQTTTNVALVTVVVILSIVIAVLSFNG